jgi:hypothetical protein
MCIFVVKQAMIAGSFGIGAGEKKTTCKVYIYYYSDGINIIIYEEIRPIGSENIH